jgi:hypothetical protein
MSVEELSRDRISRQRLLKRAGVAGAVLLAAPVMASTATGRRASSPSAAQYGRRHTCGRGFQCGGDPCLNQSPCKPPDASCTCVQRLAGGGTLRCFCHQASFCSDLSPCDQGSDCPEGWACASSCCAGLNCLPPCGTFVAGHAQGSGRMSTG